MQLFFVVRFYNFTNYFDLSLGRKLFYDAISNFTRIMDLKFLFRFIKRKSILSVINGKYLLKMHGLLVNKFSLIIQQVK